MWVFVKHELAFEVVVFFSESCVFFCKLFEFVAGLAGLRLRWGVLPYGSRRTTLTRFPIQSLGTMILALVAHGLATFSTTS